MPVPVYDGDQAPLPDGDIVVMPVPIGTPLTLTFASPYEPWLVLGTSRVLEDRSADSRTALLWLSRRLPALYRALDQMRGLRGVLHEGMVTVTDCVVLDSTATDGAFVDHGTLQSLFDSARISLPPFAVITDLGGRFDLSARARTMYASGTPVEVRIEDQGRVVGRRRLRVGR